jgi:hypothetical protein
MAPLPPEVMDQARAKWAYAVRVGNLGVPVNDLGDYVPFSERCAPGLGWPLARDVPGELR